MRRLLIYLFLILLSCPAWARGEVHLVLSEPGAAYQEAAAAFTAVLGTRAVTRWLASDLNQTQIQAMTSGANLIVPIGLKALRLLGEQPPGQASLLSLMVPRASVERHTWPRRKVSAVTIDQPLSRSLRLASLLAPRGAKVGMLVSRDTQAVLRQAEQELARRGLTIESVTVDRDEEIGLALRRLLPEVQVVVLWPDTWLNTTSLQNILLGAYRQRIPVVGFSSSQVRAGAAAALFSTPAQIGHAGGLQAVRWLAEDAELPTPQSTLAYKVQVNRQVVRSLDISLPDDEELTRQVAAWTD